MINKININHLGIFRNFQWDSVRDGGNNVVALKKVNIIYGRNYSGKTTLSRVLRALETRQLSDKYENPEFEVITDAGIFNQSSFSSCSLQIRCFNEDFIKENLRFIISGEDDIKPFAILGDNGNIENKIEELKSKLGSSQQGEETLLYKELLTAAQISQEKKINYRKVLKILDDQLAEKATGKSGIKQNHAFYGDISYNITKLKSEIEEILNGGLTVIDADQKERNLKLIEENEKSKLSFFPLYKSKIDEFSVLIKQLVTKSILASSKIQQLVENALLNDWVKRGRNLHYELGLQTCSFCGSEIKEGRWKELELHFDEETQQLEQNLISLTNKINDEKDLALKLLDNVEPNSFYLRYEEDVNRQKIEYSKVISLYVTELEKLLAFANKRADNIHKPILYDFASSFDQKYFEDIIRDLNEIVDNNNNYTSKLKGDKVNAKSELRQAEIRDFIDAIKYNDQQVNITSALKENDTAEQEKDQIAEHIKSLEEQVDELTRKLNDEEAGALKVNEYLNNYFGHTNLSLEATQEEVESEKKIRFNIVRDGKIAYHLSEGECSLIAFCYFMAKLDDIHTSFHKPIILIDDPISSLDANHIFFVYSLINSELFYKDRFEQIFLSTHNLDFLKYLKRLKSEKHKPEYFIINRYNQHSSISPMPQYLKDYITEFNYLFDQIYKCANLAEHNDETHHIVYNFGNNVRKFLEALLFYKYPSRQDSSTTNANSKRLLKYFGDDKQATVLTERVSNELSHLEEIFDRGMSPVEVPEIKKVAQFVLDKIKERDKDQYEALLESIGKSATTPLTVVA